MVQARSFYEDHSGHKLGAKSINLPACWLVGLGLGAGRLHLPVQNEDAERQSLLRGRLCLVSFKLGKQTGFGVGTKLASFSSDSEGHLEV